MPTMFQKAAAMLGRTLPVAAGITVSYRRGMESVALTAIKGKSDHTKTDNQGFSFEMQSDDFIVVASELILSGSTIEPREGDEIRETVGSETWVFEILPTEGGICWRWSDQTRKLMRIHTKRIRKE